MAIPIMDQDRIRVFGGDDDCVWVAPLGSTLPTDLGDLDPAIEPVGTLGDEGMSLARDVEVQKFRAHQGGKVVRTKVTSSEKKITFVAWEDNDVVADLRDKVLSKTTVGDVTASEISDAVEVKTRAIVVDLYDSDVHVRYACPRVEITTTGDEPWKNSEIAASTFEATIIGSYWKYVGPVA